MTKMYNVSIDLTKIDKTRVQTVNKEGQPFKNGAKYYNLTVVVNDEADQYGNHVSVQDSQTKEERDAKVDRVYLGNGKMFWSGDNGSRPAAQQQAPQAAVEDDQDLPF